MGGEGKTHNSDAETFLSSHRADLIKNKLGSGVQLPPTPDHDHDDENTAINIPRTLKPIKIKIKVDVDPLPPSDQEDQDGLKTPTGEDHMIPENPACPPAPKKQRMPLKRRRTLFDSSNEIHTQRPIMRLIELSHEGIELIFPRRTGIIHHHHRPGTVRKPNKTALMSFI